MANIEPYALANSRRIDLPADGSEQKILMHIHPLSATERAARNSERVWSAFQYRRGETGALRISSLLPKAAVSAHRYGKTSHDPHLALALRWIDKRGNDPFIGLRDADTRLELLLPGAKRHIHTGRSANRPRHTWQPLVRFTNSKFSTSGAQSFQLIEHARRFLRQQRIRDARHTLELGSIWYPEDRQIAKLLRTISPGRVSPTDQTSPDREKETAWIKQHGHKYRGLWIALDKDRLIAFASTLEDLLANISSEHNPGKSAFVQYLLSE